MCVSTKNKDADKYLYILQDKIVGGTFDELGLLISDDLSVLTNLKNKTLSQIDDVVHKSIGMWLSTSKDNKDLLPLMTIKGDFFSTQEYEPLELGDGVMPEIINGANIMISKDGSVSIVDIHYLLTASSYDFHSIIKELIEVEYGAILKEMDKRGLPVKSWEYLEAI